MTKNINNETDLFISNLSKDFVRLSKVFKTSLGYIENNSHFDYPIIIVSESEVELGIPFLDKEKAQNNLVYSLTFLDHVVKNGVLAPDLVYDFKNDYKKKNEHCCMLVIQEKVKRFIYMPYTL